MALEWEEPKDPDEVLDYQLNWATRLVPGDEILTSTWILPEGIVRDSDEQSISDTTIWLSSGVLGATYDILNRVTTSGGRTMDQTVRLKCKAK